MEFIIFLSKIDKEIIELINKANYSIVENTALCNIDKKFVGFFKKDERKIVICTSNVKKTSNYNDKNYGNENHKTRVYLRRALRHEATHLAQSCNGNKATGIIKDIEEKLHKGKVKALNSSVKISGNYSKELEAYVMEDKPKKVKKIIEKYCL